MKALLWLLFCFMGLSLAAVFQHELIKLESQKMKMMREGTWGAYKQSTQSKLFTQNIDNMYLINVTIGTPDQSFKLLFDTTVTDFWVIDSAPCAVNGICPAYCSDETFCEFLCDWTCCLIGKSNPFCDGLDTFNSSKSSTYVPTNMTSYNGIANTTVGQDIIRIGNVGDEQLVIPNSFFGSQQVLEGYRFDGVFGLGIPQNESYPSPISNLVNQGLLDAPIITIYLTNDLKGDKKGYGGAITFGAVDTEHCDVPFVLVYHKLTNSTLFQFQVDSVTIGDFYTSPSFNAISASLEETIELPTAVLSKIMEHYNVIDDVRDGIYFIDCDSDIKLTFNIDGMKYTVDKELVLPYNSTACMLQMYPSNDDVWTLGYPWLRSYCNIYNYGDSSIGFAKIKSH